MTTHSRTGLEVRGWPDSRIGRRAVTLAGLSVTGIVLLVLGSALGLLPVVLLLSEIALGKF